VAIKGREFAVEAASDVERGGAEVAGSQRGEEGQSGGPHRRGEERK
jgi:hypothetical protein